ncbi:SMI1/KNR4 family protein [Archangium violaceum]|uniref:SMI1/KNR4 family protein n=1 Tax=Archangium violaceum TaxID=83451 RepID=UPI002B2984A6|nr:SMI1/KNR4 family protein [Archangium violaceum]
MAIHWKPYLLDGSHPIEASRLHPIEQAWGVRLPDTYKQIVCRYQGMAPEPCVFNVGGGEDVFNDLLTITPIEGRESYSVMRVYEVLEPHIPTGLFPFGRTPGGEYLCFDFRDAPDSPRIALVTSDMSILPVANTLQAFLEGLHDG